MIKHQWFNECKTVRSIPREICSIFPYKARRQSVPWFTKIITVQDVVNSFLRSWSCFVANNCKNIFTVFKIKQPYFLHGFAYVCIPMCVPYVSSVCLFFAKQVTNRKFERVKWKCPKLTNFCGTFLTFRNINANQFDRSFLVSFLWGNFFLRFPYLKFRSNKAYLV